MREWQTIRSLLRVPSSVLQGKVALKEGEREDKYISSQRDQERLKETVELQTDLQRWAKLDFGTW